MSTPNHPHAIPTLQQIQSHLLEIDPTLRTRSKRPFVLPAELITLEATSAVLKRVNAAYEQQAHALYAGLEQADLAQSAGQQLLVRLKAQLASQLQDLDETSIIENQSRKTYVTVTAGISALEQEARLNVNDYLLSPTDLSMLEDCSRGPTLRPGMYALTFSYQEQTVTFAGAFVLTRKASPVVDSFNTSDSVGPVLLFTPSRGLEAFDSLSDLGQRLQSAITTRAGQAELNRHLPVQYQHFDAVDMFSLSLQPIEGKPLFEHTYQAVLDKRKQDIHFALSLAEGGQLNAAGLKVHLDNAIKAALPDLTMRLDFRAQLLLERDLFNTLPDWYRSATDDQRKTLDQHLLSYNQARQQFLDLFGPASTPHALARYQWAAYLGNRWDMHDLDPDQLQITTRRKVAQVGTYDQQRSLVELALRGLHPDDNKPGSDFLKHSTLSYVGTPLGEEHAYLTPQHLITPLQSLQPRLDFANVQKSVLGTPAIKKAARSFFDQRLVVMAHLATRQGHLNQADFQLFEDLREKPRPQLCAQTVMFHGAQLKDLWLLREEDASGQLQRLLLCTPDAPRTQQFFGFSTLRECQTHILAWLDNTSKVKGRGMTDYLLEQVPLRFRPTMSTVIQRIGFKPDGQEHLKVTFGIPCSHSDCLDAMAEHRLTQLLDDYELATPAWYRAASAADRQRLTQLGDDAAGALRTYNARADSEANFQDFNSYLHEKAKLSLNQLLGRRQNDIDPDTIFAYASKPLIGAGSPPMSYTQLFRDGYDDGIGFLNEKFSRSATFRGPPEVNLSVLTAQNVARSVTGVWIGERYIDEVRQRFQSSQSAGYTERRNAVLAIQQLQMKSAALESRLKGHIASVDLEWLEKAIDSLADTATTTRDTYKIHRLYIEGEWIIGNYLFSHANDPVLLYTPDAPDGIAFREARLFNYLLKQVDGMLTYWFKRASQPSMARVKLFLETARKGLPEDINRTTPSPARYDAIARLSPLTDLRHEFYNMNLQRKIDDVHGTTANRTQMILGTLWTCIEWVTAVATMPFPVLSLTLGGLLAVKDAMLALNAYYQNDKTTALDHYIGYMGNFFGAVLFDVRPALTGALKPLRVLRPVLKPGQQATQSALIGKLDTLAPENMQPVLFEGRALWASNTPTSEGLYVLYRLDPQTRELHSTARLAKRDPDGQWTRPTVRGGGNEYEALQPGYSSPLEVFDMTGEQATTFRHMLDANFKQRLPGIGDDLDEAVLQRFHEQTSPLREAYALKVRNLAQRADTFFQAPRPTVTKRTVPTLAGDATHTDIVKTLFVRDSRLIIGCAKSPATSLQLLIEQLPTLVEQGLKRVYIEYLPRDLFYHKLKILSNKLPGDKAKALGQIKQQLAAVDDVLGLSGADFNYSKLLDETRRLNVEIDGLDGSASYHLDQVLALGDESRFTPRSSKLRNFYSHTAIENNLSDNPGEGWVALVASDRLGTYERVAGLAELENTLALRIKDVASGQPTGVTPDTTALAQSRGDYTLSMTMTAAAPSTSGTVSPPSTAANHFAEFDLPRDIHPRIWEMQTSRHGLDTQYVYVEPTKAEALRIFRTTRSRLARAAESAFANYTPTPRASLTQISTASEKVFIEQVYQHKLGLVIGESHIQRSAKKLLNEHMQLLKKQGVKTLYIEHLLSDLHQEALDTYHRTSKMPAVLKNYLKYLDSGHMPRYSGPDNFTNIVKTANKYGLRVRALDCTVSYNVKGLSGNAGRGELFSYFANEVIKADQLAQGAHKWVGFVGATHTNMHQGVPGHVELQEAISVHVFDTYPSRAKSLRSGGWHTVSEQNPIVAVRSDFRLDVSNIKDPEPRHPTLPDRTRLKQVGQFFIEYPSDFEVNLVHRSRSGQIVTTPFQIDDRGRYFIEYWEDIRDRRFYSLSLLIDLLKTPGRAGGIGLTQIT
ncbi:membrane-targeted effector domain-containing toxin [Pseudomonas azotoformans]